MATPTNPTVLISGASIAGPTLAYWLVQYGFQVTVVERAPELRLGGQNIDVNGPARKVARLMGITDRIRAAGTGELGMRFIKPDGEVAGAFPTNSAGTATQELEILRGNLVEILYDVTKSAVDYRFGDSIAHLAQQADGVAVTFASGRAETFQVVVVADGVRSSTRQLVFGDEPRFKFTGLYMAYLTIARQATDTKWWSWYIAPGRRALMLRPDNHGTTRATVAFMGPDEAYDRLSLDQQKAVLQAKVAGAGWQAERIGRGIAEAQDMYLEKVGQILAPRWSEGRVVLLGDAAYCASLLTGKGTTLAMTGAYILAGELARHARPEEAFAAYEQKMRPWVTDVQKLPPGVPGAVYPASRLGVAALNTLAGVAASKPVQALLGLFGSGSHEPEDNELALPDYSALAASKA